MTAHLAAEYGGTNGKPFNAIFDCVGSDDLFRQCASYLDKSGIFITIVGGVGAGPIMRSKLLPVSLGGVPRRYKLLALWPDGAIAKEAAKWVEDGSFHNFPIDSEFSMDDAVQVGCSSYCFQFWSMNVKNMLICLLGRVMSELLASAQKEKSWSRSLDGKCACTRGEVLLIPNHRELHHLTGGSFSRVHHIGGDSLRYFESITLGRLTEWLIWTALKTLGTCRHVAVVTCFSYHHKFGTKLTVLKSEY